VRLSEFVVCRDYFFFVAAFFAVFLAAFFVAICLFSLSIKRGAATRSLQLTKV